MPYCPYLELRIHYIVHALYMYMYVMCKNLLALHKGFVVFLGLLLPGTAMALWTFWECCYEKDEEEEEENR